MRLGDPWGMIYGGSGWWQDAPADELGGKCRAEAEKYAGWGVRSSRVGICWTNVEKVRGQYDWSEPDAVLPAVSATGIHLVLCVATTPEWAWQFPEVGTILAEQGKANLAGTMPFKDECWPDYERYLRELVQRYRTCLKHYEIWNEPDGMSGFRFFTDEKGGFIGFEHGGDPDWYAELVRRSYRIVKSIDPEARVGIGSFEKKTAMPPFELDMEFAGELDEKKLTDELRHAFKGKPDTALSAEGFVSHVDPGKRWVITDNHHGRRYTITRRDDKLAVTDRKTWFFERLYENGIRNHYDAVSIHPYGDPFGREWLGAVRAVMVEQGEADRPMWVNEYGLHGRGVELAFNTRRQIRLLRETPWISVAQPLVFACHFDQQISPHQRSLRAHRQMAAETGPRRVFKADFEGSLLTLLDQWEWNATGAGPEGIDDPELRTEYPHAGQRCLSVTTPGTMVRVWFAPYVKAEDRVLAGHLLIEPAADDAEVTLAFGVESGDILQPVRHLPAGNAEITVHKWSGFLLPIDERIPEWRDLAVVTCYVEVRSDKPGLRVSVDDVLVGPRSQASPVKKGSNE